MGWFSSSNSSSSKQLSCEKIRLKYLDENNNVDIQSAFNRGCGIFSGGACAFLKKLGDGDFMDDCTCLYFEESGLSRNEARGKSMSNIKGRGKCAYYSQYGELDSVEMKFIDSKS
jgi:hypothetical protein